MLIPSIPLPYPRVVKPKSPAEKACLDKLHSYYLSEWLKAKSEATLLAMDTADKKMNIDIHGNSPECRANLLLWKEEDTWRLMTQVGVCFRDFDDAFFVAWYLHRSSLDCGYLKTIGDSNGFGGHMRAAITKQKEAAKRATERCIDSFSKRPGKE